MSKLTIKVEAKSKEKEIEYGVKAIKGVSETLKLIDGYLKEQKEEQRK